ncbi:hypothetical protein [Chelativorans sp. YIM 93263]|uniref:hypothetical protein n=1 Tax=Chelativorans sp. YIM 93263 TaxID=2906648 RepID=UPI002378D339|nr:hypothetical protein [Chelativorans sp. YIM 93263]
MRRPRHPNKDIEEAVAYAESKGWTWRKQGHWGRLYCPFADREGCQVGVNGTPRNPSAHARQLMRAIDRCPHENEEQDDENL